MILSEITSRVPEYFLVLLGALASGILSWFVARKNIPRAYRVAVIGFPQAGKTSLITAVFAHLFRSGIRGASIVPRGEETITRINSHIADMESGAGVAPTRDQDLFAYRAEVQSRSLFFFSSLRYKLEIGDFPGEQTESFIGSEQPWLHNTNYFQWAMGADAFIFVVDAKKVYDEQNNYVARQKSAFRAAWQRIQEHHIDGASGLKSKVVILVYSKADQVIGFPGGSSELMHRCKDLKRQLDLEFSDFIDYLKRDSKDFKTVLTSVALHENGERLGVPTVSEYVLPRWRYF